MNEVNARGSVAIIRVSEVTGSVQTSQRSLRGPVVEAKRDYCRSRGIQAVPVIIKRQLYTCSMMSPLLSNAVLQFGPEVNATKSIYMIPCSYK